MIREPFVKPIYDVRWRLEYHDGTRTKLGFWSREADRLDEMATFKKTDGLARAIIEAKHRDTGELTVPVSCAGHDFCLFKWRSVARLGLSLNTARPMDECKVAGEIVGLILVTRNFEATFHIDGRMPVVRRTEKEKSFHYEGYGR